jgi:ABC-type transport system substrate-binding protein
MHGRGEGRRSSPAVVARLLAALAVAVAAGCGSSDRGPRASPPSSTLRIGLGQTPATTQTSGLPQLAGLLTREGLFRAGEDGRMQPWAAESLALSDDGRSLTITLRPGVKFSDGTPLDAATVAQLLPAAVESQAGPVFDDLESIAPSGTRSLTITFRRSSMFHVEALEATITKPGKTRLGTGPFIAAADSTAEFRANPDYYLGKPAIDRVVVSMFPSVRAAWAEALRGNLDALYEVGSDALDSLEHSTTISTHVFTRRYQHVIVLNSRAPALRLAQTRRALNALIDRKAFVREALNGHGVESDGPFWPRYWALPSTPLVAAGTQNPASDIKGKLTFTCLVGENDVAERMALEIKRQFAAVGIEMNVESASQEAILKRAAKGDYEAALVDDLISGPTLIRLFNVWSSESPSKTGFTNETVSTAINRARSAETEDDFKKAVAEVQRAFRDDPPAIFLAWNQRARAVSNRFVVPPPEPGRDIMSTLRLWKPADAAPPNHN